MAIGPPAKGFLRILALPLHQNALTFYSVPAVAAVEANEVPEAEQNLRWKMTVKWPNDARQMWLDLGNAPDGTLKNRLYQTGTRLMDSIAEEEYFLKTVSPKVSEGEILVPNALDPSQTRQKLAELCRNRIPYHKRWRTLSVAGLPFSTAAGLVPGPNVFLLYNGKTTFFLLLNVTQFVFPPGQASGFTRTIWHSHTRSISWTC
ncbi:mitochondrial K+-H+ exchange-related-domain-containing protein [Hyaloraphidium curvatum]|nr:mitochondrial K+-H+ exchange-related-domain-containing protein [Hyaloraphidium curvatum]